MLFQEFRKPNEPVQTLRKNYDLEKISSSKYYDIDDFADDTNLLCLSNSIKKLSKLVNANLRYLVSWLNANKISLSLKKKTEMVIYKSKQKKFEGDLTIKLCRKRLCPTESVKYLVVKT